MNPTDLQRRLDATALEHEPATVGDWNRHLELRRRRSRRRRGAWIAGAAAAVAAVTVVALNWNPPTNSVEIVPAEPTGFQESDVDARAVDPAELTDVYERCAAIGNSEGFSPTPFAARSEVADAVVVRRGNTYRFCADWDDVGINDAMTVELPTASAGGRTLGTILPDGSELVSSWGTSGAEYADVVVTDPQGLEHEAVIADGIWWTPVRVAPGADWDQITWVAHDVHGTPVGGS